MFWKKRTYADPQLGTFRYSWGRWSGKVKGPDGSVLALGIVGERDRPDPLALERMRELVLSIAAWKQVALDYLWERQDVRKFAAGNGELILDQIDVGREEDSFDLSFSLTEYLYGYVTVRFTGAKPTGVIMGD